MKVHNKFLGSTNMNKQQTITPETIEIIVSDIDRMQPKLPAASEMLHLVGRVAAYIGDAQARGLSPEEIYEDFRKMGNPVKTKTKRSTVGGVRHPRRQVSDLEAPLARLGTQQSEKAKPRKIA
jgi:hypothetical protein